MMSAGEKMVWAAVFAAQFQKSKKGGPRFISEKERAAWERGCAADAVAHAGETVKMLRDVVPQVRDDWQGVKSPVYSYFLEMLEF